MRLNTHTLLKAKIILCVVLASLLTAPAVYGLQSAETVIMKVKDKADPVAIAAQFGVTILDSVPELDTYLVSGSAANLARLNKSSDVVSIEYNVSAEISETAMLNESTVALLDPSTVALLDGEHNKMWDSGNPRNSTVLTQPSLQKIGLDPASVQPRGQVTVAVIDTGVDPFHEMLIGSVLPGHNFINESLSTNELLDLDPATAALLLQAGGRAGLNGSVAVINPATVALLDPEVVEALSGKTSLYFGHGTLVSGLIHAIAPTAHIMPLKVFDSSGIGTSFRIAKAVVYATAQQVQVINMSFSLDGSSTLVSDALHYAGDRHIVLVASIGNKNSKVDKIYPASYDKVVGVAATDLKDLKASFSNYGGAAQVSAPGVGLISPYPGGLYAAWSGTSASAALVSGEAAFVLLQRGPNGDDARSRVSDKSDHLNDPPYQLGKGRIDLKTVLK